MARPRATVIHLGRAAGLGELRRVATWTDLLARAGAEVDEIALLRDHRRRRPLVRPSDLVGVGRRSLALETLAWDAGAARRRMRANPPALAVFVTARAYHPRLAAAAGLGVLDFVDQLSRAYRHRATIVASRPRSLGFRVLAWSHSGFEPRPLPAGLRRIAAGWTDARRLDAQWLPVPVAPMERVDPACADRDVLFFGTLGYPPNVDALRRLGSLWPQVLARRPGTTALVAGARPTAEVRRLAAGHAWELIDGFDDVRTLCARARIAVAPLRHAAGIQSKVLEAAAAGVAQVVSEAALAGLAPGFPAVSATTDGELVTGIVELLEDAPRRDAIAQAARRQARELYSPEHWTPAVAALLAEAAAGRQARR